MCLDNLLQLENNDDGYFDVGQRMIDHVQRRTRLNILVCDYPESMSPQRRFAAASD